MASENSGEMGAANIGAEQLLEHVIDHLRHLPAACLIDAACVRPRPLVQGDFTLATASLPHNEANMYISIEIAVTHACYIGA